MNRRFQRDETGPGWMVLCSLLIHGLVLLLITSLNFLPSPMTEEPVYYVDVVNLPVASPQAGAPSASAAPAAPPEPAESRLTLPVPAKTKPAGPTPPKPAATMPATPGKKPEPESGDRELKERLTRLERENEARHEASALDALRKKLNTGKGAPGMPKGKGSESGSDYGAYIQSRLRDALALTIAFQTKHPEMAVRLFIDKKGKLVRFVIEKSSRDKLFDDAVLRAIDRAKASFPPPPTGSDFENLYVFSPDEVNKR